MQLDNRPFQGLIRLTELYPEYNQIVDLVSEAFVGVPSLTELHLSGNKKVQSDNRPFQGLIKLQKLNLCRTKPDLVRIDKNSLGLPSFTDVIVR